LLLSVMFSADEAPATTGARWSDEATEDLVDIVLADPWLVQGLLIDPGNRSNESLY